MALIHLQTQSHMINYGYPFLFSIDEFVIECPCLGRLEKVRVGHDNSGFGPGWYLDQVGASYNP